MTKVLRDAIDAALLEVHTSMPAAIEKYDFATNLAQVKPQFKRKFRDNASPVAIPIISNVPVLHPRMGGAHLRLPVAKGDTGLLIFAERSLDRWLDGAGDHDPQDPRRHALSDAVFIPGLSPTPNKMSATADATSVELRNKAAFVELTQGSRFKIGNTTDELLQLLLDLIDQLIAATVLVSSGSSAGTWPLSPGVITALQSIRNRLANNLKA